MSSEEEKEKHSRRRKRNIVKKHMSENKGAYAIKIIDSRKPEYERVNMRVADVEGIEDDDKESGTRLF